MRSPMKLVVSAAAVLAITTMGGCRSAQTNRAASSAPNRAASNGRCNGFGEMASYYLGTRPSPKQSSFPPAPEDGKVVRLEPDLPGNATITRPTIRGFCYTTPESIAAAERKRDAGR
jgi:hypothetical protein